MKQQFCLNKIENIIYPKIEIFKNEIREKIVNLFINYHEKENNTIKSNLNYELIDLLPNLNDSFRNILDNFSMKKL